jgi:hypothetical protein
MSKVAELSQFGNCGMVASLALKSNLDSRYRYLKFQFPEQRVHHHPPVSRMVCITRLWPRRQWIFFQPVTKTWTFFFPSDPVSSMRCPAKLPTTSPTDGIFTIMLKSDTDWDAHSLLEIVGISHTLRRNEKHNRS